MKKKFKIEYGQCYEYLDHIWMIIDGRPRHSRNGKRYYDIQNTLTKECSTISEVSLLSLHRPFQNWVS
jgi:hypothetical protein